MRISTKVECGIIALLDIALNMHDEHMVKIRSISQRTHISAKYLEQILPLLKQSDLISSGKGASGGYRISRELGKITLYEIMNALDRTILTSSEFSESLEHNATAAIDKCLWKPITGYLCKYTRSITLKDLADRYSEQKNYNDDIAYISAYV